MRPVHRAPRPAHQGPYTVIRPLPSAHRRTLYAGVYIFDRLPDGTVHQDQHFALIAYEDSHCVTELIRLRFRDKSDIIIAEALETVITEFHPSHICIRNHRDPHFRNREVRDVLRRHEVKIAGWYW